MQQKCSTFDLFTYGTLQCEDIMASVAGNWKARVPAGLANYRCQQVKNEHYPAIIPCPGEVVLGTLYSGIQAENLARLDAFEGDMYQRLTVTISLTDNSAREVFTYVIKPSQTDHLEPLDWSLENFLSRGKDAFIARYVGFEKLL